MKRVLKVGLCVGVAVLIVTSCGGGTDSGEATDAPSSQPAADSTADTAEVVATTSEPPAVTTDPPVTTPAASTTSVDPRPIDPEDEALAMAATQHAASFAEPWKVYAEGMPSPVSTESCSFRPDGAVTHLTNGASQSGPTMQLADNDAFIGSGGLAFPDEMLAIEYISVLNTDDWAACQLQKFQLDSGSASVIELATRESASLNQDGFESYAEFHVKSSDGTLERVVMQSFYRLGRSVIMQIIEYGAVSDTDLDQLVNDAYSALSDSYDRVNALL